ASKARLFAMQSPENVAVVMLADGASAGGAHAAKSKYLIAVPVYDFGDPEWPTLHNLPARSQSGWPTLQGPHNAQNAAAAIEAARTLGLPDEAIVEGFETYPG